MCYVKGNAENENPFSYYFHTVEAKIVDGDRPDIRSMRYPGYAKIIESCWAQIPSARPSIDEVIEKLEKELEILSG